LGELKEQVEQEEHAHKDKPSDEKLSTLKEDLDILQA
jgi:hypothetical protein